MVKATAVAAEGPLQLRPSTRGRGTRTSEGLDAPWATTELEKPCPWAKIDQGPYPVRVTFNQPTLKVDEKNTYSISLNTSQHAMCIFQSVTM